MKAGRLHQQRGQSGAGLTNQVSLSSGPAVVLRGEKKGVGLQLPPIVVWDLHQPVISCDPTCTDLAGHRVARHQAGH
jgi:hypothetical protein